MSRLGRQLGRPVFTIHRLDRATSGVLLFALSSEAARKMCLLFEERRIRKEYLAVVRGFAPETGRIDHPLRKDSNKPAADAVTDFVRMGTAELQEPLADMIQRVSHWYGPFLIPAACTRSGGTWPTSPIPFSATPGTATARRTVLSRPIRYAPSGADGRPSRVSASVYPRRRFCRRGTVGGSRSDVYCAWLERVVRGLVSSAPGFLYTLRPP